MGSLAEKSLVEINQTESPGLSYSEGMLGERTQTGTGEMVSKELSLRYSELTFAQANRQAISLAQVQGISEMLNMG